MVYPTSLLGNWQRELARFAPSVPVRRYHGGDRHLEQVADDEVVLVSYGVVRHHQAPPRGADLGPGGGRRGAARQEPAVAHCAGSGKLTALDELLDIILDAGDSALVFSQYVQMCRLVQAHLAVCGVPTLLLSGTGYSTPSPPNSGTLRRCWTGSCPRSRRRRHGHGTGDGGLALDERQDLTRRSATLLGRPEQRGQEFGPLAAAERCAAASSPPAKDLSLAYAS